MTEEDHERKRYRFLHEYAEEWQIWFEVVVLAIVIGFALFCAAYSTFGFWAGLWDIVKHT